MKKQKSFTLIELLVVLAIIGVISSIVLVNLRGTREKARITKSLEFSQTVQNVIGAYAVGVWSFETIEQPGDIVLDGSGYGNDGTVYGAVLSEGIVGNALEFDGVNDYVDILHDNSLNQMGELTVSFWVKGVNENAPNGYWGIFDKENYQSDGWVVFLLNGTATNLKRIQFRSSYSPLNTTRLTSVEKDLTSWSYIAVTFDNGDAVIYLNGQSIASGTLAINSIIINTNPLIIGWESSRYFNGIIDEVGIYSEALTTAEIQKHYVEGLKKHKNLVKD